MITIRMMVIITAVEDIVEDMVDTGEGSILAMEVMEGSGQVSEDLDQVLEDLEDLVVDMVDMVDMGVDFTLSTRSMDKNLPIAD